MLGLCCAIMLMGPSGPGILGPGEDMGAIASEIATLQTCPDWKQRERAAHRLRKFDWRCHPEVAWALVEAMLHDCKDCVRKEAAQSLKKLAPCLPAVHEALSYTSRCDPNHCTRFWARWALKTLGKHCEGPCSVCGPAAGPGPGPGPIEVIGPGPLGSPLPPLTAPPMAWPSGIDPTIWKVPVLPRPGTTTVPSVIVPTPPPNVPPGPIGPPLAEPLELPPL
jgi:hypothetical protein